MMPEQLFSVDTAPDGTTVIVTRSHVRLVLGPEASAELADHFLNAFPVRITLRPNGRYHTTVDVPVEQEKI